MKTTAIAVQSGIGSATTLLMLCGILSSVHYIAINTFVPLAYDGYSFQTQTVSELSAIGAPTRLLWVWLCSLYVLLFAAFGVGVRQSAGTNRPLRAMGTLMIIYAVFNVYWPPMHVRGNAPTLTDTLHIIWAMVTVAMMITIMVLGAAALDRKFRIYTIISISLHVIFGFLTSLEGPKIATNEPTPWIGVWERINIGVFMVWVIVLALRLMPERKREPVGGSR